MKKITVLFLALIFAGISALKADEGMWVPLLLKKNIAEMHKLGCKLSAEDIYSINHSSLKDAIVIFGGGCTGEIVSPEGLLFTNHHCGYGSIQKVSTVEHDYLKDGFWAYTKEEEIPIEGLTVKFLVKMEDVTGKALEGVDDKMTEEQRNEIIRKNSQAIEKEASEDGKYMAVVKPIFGGNNYYVYVYEVYKDIRLVGTPPSAIGKFGGDTDNWMWPRHTGDFSIFRVYTAPDGSPAEYSENNIPLKPKHYLPVNISPKRKGDFAMIMGNPGSTDRYLSSYGVDMAINLTNPLIVKIRDKKLKVMKEGMTKDPAVNLQYATKYAHTSNYWKYFIGQTKALKRLKVKEEKQQLEAELANWINKDEARKEKYGEIFSDLQNAYEGLKGYETARYYFIEGIYRGPEILRFANRFNRLKKALEDKNTPKEKIDKMVSSLRESAKKYFKDYNEDIDRNLLASLMEMYSKDVPADQQPIYLLNVEKKYKGDFNKYAGKLFERSIFSSPEKVNAFLDKPSAKKIAKDPAFVAWNAFYEKYKEIAKESNRYNDLLSRGRRLFIAALREMNPDKNYYPDANFTMRLTYGTVQDYYPADAVHYDFVTHLYGVMEKEDPNNPEFIVPDKLKELYKAKDFGQYGENGHLITDFLSTNDITGGNSGSPIMNGNGELIGLAFDGNWEAMSGDIKFDSKLQRTINVDIRYVLFIIDKYAGAKNLIDELTIIKEHPVIKKDVPSEKKAEKEAVISE